MQKIVFDFFFVVLELKIELGDPPMRQMIRIRRNAGPQKRDPVLIEDHELGADILDGMADIVDDDALQGSALRRKRVRAGAFDDDFAR